VAGAGGAGATYDYRPAPAAVLERARRLRAACDRLGARVEAVALQLPLAHPAVACVLTGTRSDGEMRSNAADFERTLPRGLWAALREEGLLAAAVPTPDRGDA